jgi:hypothetical protein
VELYPSCPYIFVAAIILPFERWIVDGGEGEELDLIRYTPISNSPEMPCCTSPVSSSIDLSSSASKMEQGWTGV